MCKELCVELLLPGYENNKDGNTYLCYDRERWKGKKICLESSTKERSLVLQARMKRKREKKGVSSDFNKKLYLLIVISYVYVLKYISPL
jgi:hypothetical protein